MLCHRGCGLESKYVNYKGLGCCDKSHHKCPVVAKKKSDAQKGTPKPSVSMALVGRKLSDQHKKNIGTAHIGKTVSIETIEKIRAGNKLTKQNQEIVAWNKGLTKSDPRVALYATAQKGQKRATRIKVIPSTDPVYNDIKKYRNRIAVRTRKIYEEFKHEINPTNLPIGKCGIDGAHQIDHIMSVREGFTYSVPIEMIASKENLRTIPWLDNNSKYSKVDYSIVPESIQQYLKGN